MKEIKIEIERECIDTFFASYLVLCLPGKLVIRERGGGRRRGSKGEEEEEEERRRGLRGRFLTFAGNLKYQVIFYATKGSCYVTFRNV